ncbi:hypothetical protein HHX47_DHR3000784 [Lentinula edodes]|nr:hypothetical protein HHX47_DHR3000784 [Lentinula edodes]
MARHFPGPLSGYIDRGHYWLVGIAQAQCRPFVARKCHPLSSGPNIADGTGHWGEALFALPTLTFKRPKSIYISCVKAPQTIGGGLLERVAMKKRPDNRCLSNFVQECLSQSGVALVSSLSDDELTFSFGGLGFFDLIIHRLHGAVVEYIAP